MASIIMEFFRSVTLWVYDKKYPTGKHKLFSVPDDLVLLISSSKEESSCLLQVVAEFCELIVISLDTDKCILFKYKDIVTEINVMHSLDELSA